MANNAYSDVTITSDELASLEETTASPIPAESETTQNAEVQQPEETSQEATESSEVEDNGDVDFEEVYIEPKIEIDGELYSAEDVKPWLEDSKNKSEWQKSNTEKAQELSKWNKFAEKISNDDSFKEHIKDYFFDNPEDFNKLGLDEMKAIEVEIPEIQESQNTKIPDEVAERLNKLEESEWERTLEHRVDLLDSELTKLESEHKDVLGSPEQVEEFLEFAEVNAPKFQDENGVPSMSRMFKEWSYDAKMAELEHYKKLDENKNRNSGKVIGKSQMGAKESKSPAKYKTFKEVSMKDPDIAKYFE